MTSLITGIIFSQLLVFSYGADGTIGLVYPIRDFHVSTEKEEIVMYFRMKILDELTYPVNLLNAIKLSLTNILNIPGVKEQPTISALVTRQINSIIVSIGVTSRSLETIIKYRGSEIKTPTEACSAELADNIDMLIFTAETYITNAVTALGNPPVASVTVGSNEYNDILNVIQDSYLHMRNVEDKVGNYLSQLEALTSGEVSADILSAVQMSSCVPEGEFDKIKVTGCEKTKGGLLCTLEVEIYLNNQKYTTFVPVNYNGVELKIPENKKLAKSNDRKYGLLSCRDEETEMVNDCIFSEWSATEFIFGNDYIAAIDHCNFTLADPPLPMQNMDRSVLIMNKKVTITTREGEGRERDLMNESPMAISFGKNLKMTAAVDKVKLKFKGGILESGVEIMTSNYNKSTITLMHKKALSEAFWNMDWVNILKYFTLVVQVIVLPVTFTTCSLSVYALIRYLIRRRKKKKEARRREKYKTRRNYEINKEADKTIRKKAWR